MDSRMLYCVTIVGRENDKVVVGFRGKYKAHDLKNSDADELADHLNLKGYKKVVATYDYSCFNSVYYNDFLVYKY